MVLALIAQLVAGVWQPTWSSAAGDLGYLSNCHMTTTVFGVPICLTPAAWDVGAAKRDHVANVVAQLLDNDADGVVDDADVVNKMVSDKYYLFVPATESDSESFQDRMPSEGKGQMSGMWEAEPNSCDTPTNRGATIDRSTWAGAKDTQTGCSPNRDATTEEVLHLITEAAAELWPEKWGKTYTSEAGAAFQAANGDCGWGFTSNYVNPSTAGCTGQYAYDDETCDVGCHVVEGIYWASVSYIGGLYTAARAAAISREWLMPTPDDSMALVPSGVTNAKTLQSGSPALYALVSDTTSAKHKWLPAVMPDGNYQGPASGASSAGSGSSGGEASEDGGNDASNKPCFPSSAMVQRADGSAARMDELSIGDEIVAATADGLLTTDAVTLLSIAEPEAHASFLTLTTEGGAALNLTAEHHLPIGPTCCSVLKRAKDVEVGETVWAVATAGERTATSPTAVAAGGRAVPMRVAKVHKNFGRGLHSPVLRRGSFPVVGGLVTSFDRIEAVSLAALALPLALKACELTGTCALLRRALLGP